MKRIYLEAKEAAAEFTGAGHLFLARRDAPNPGEENSIEWRETVE